MGIILYFRTSRGGHSRLLPPPSISCPCVDIPFFYFRGAALLIRDGNLLRSSCCVLSTSFNLIVNTVARQQKINIGTILLRQKSHQKLQTDHYIILLFALFLFSPEVTYLASVPNQSPPISSKGVQSHQ